MGGNVLVITTRKGVDEIRPARPGGNILVTSTIQQLAIYVNDDLCKCETPSKWPESVCGEGVGSIEMWKYHQQQHHER